MGHHDRPVLFRRNLEVVHVRFVHLEPVFERDIVRQQEVGFQPAVEIVLFGFGNLDDAVFIQFIFDTAAQERDHRYGGQQSVDILFHKAIHDNW